MERNVVMNISTPNDPYLATVSAVAARTTPVAGSAPDLGWRSTWVGRHRVGVFLVLAFALSWWAWPLAVRNPASSAQVSFGPIIAAFSVAAVAGGRHQVARLLRAVVHWRVPWSRYVIAVAGPFFVAAVIAMLASSFALIDPAAVGEAFRWSTWSAVPLLFVTTALLGGPLFEEVGWRGFLLDELQQRRTVLVATVVVALVWAAWHLPLLISEPTGQRPPLPFLVWILGQAVVLTWIYNISSGSVLLAILFHTAANVSGRLLLEAYVGQQGFLSLWWLMAAAYALVALVLLRATRGRLGLGPTTPPHGPAIDRTATS
jgi:membrane protease YdiL (CAAX protease family)